MWMWPHPWPSLASDLGVTGKSPGRSMAEVEQAPRLQGVIHNIEYIMHYIYSIWLFGGHFYKTESAYFHSMSVLPPPWGFEPLTLHAQLNWWGCECECLPRQCSGTHRILMPNAWTRVPSTTNWKNMAWSSHGRLICVVMSKNTEYKENAGVDRKPQNTVQTTQQNWLIPIDRP